MISAINLKYNINIQLELATLNKPVYLCWVPSHIGVRGNEEADTTARSIISTSRITPTRQPGIDFECYVKKIINKSWGFRWNATADNKLRGITDSVSSLPNLSCDNRKDWERGLTRFRIGHSNLTGFLVEGGHQPFCDDCLVPLTIKNIVIECPNYNVERMTCFNNVNLTMKYVFRLWLLFRRENMCFCGHWISLANFD